MSHDQLVAAASKRALRTLLVCTLVGLTLAACGGEKTDSASSQVEKTHSASSQVKKDAPPITAEVVYSFFVDDPLTRFAVEFTNPGEKARSGVTATWKAYDKDGVIVGSRDKLSPRSSPEGLPSTSAALAEPTSPAYPPKSRST